MRVYSKRIKTVFRELLCTTNKMYIQKFTKKLFGVFKVTPG